MVIVMGVLVAPLAAQQPPRLGTIDFPTSGAPAAQPAFIRGVLYLHSFEYPAAAEAFREASGWIPALSWRTGARR